MPEINSLKKKRLFAVRKPVSRYQAIISAVIVWIVFFVLWYVTTHVGIVNKLLVPAPEKVFGSLYDLLAEQGFIIDIGISISRVLVSFIMACIVAVPLGILMGAFPAIEAFLSPFVSAWRYLPAPSFIPILLMWFGTGEAPKLALMFMGVVFFLITLVMDATKNIRSELIETALTLGSNRRITLFNVVLPAVLPDVFVAMRQMLAMVWTYLVIAEIVASTTGIGAMMMRARRFLNTDDILAGILVIGILGLSFDLLFSRLHLRLFPYLQEKH